jgi:hypothetical protein
MTWERGSLARQTENLAASLVQLTRVSGQCRPKTGRVRLSEDAELYTAIRASSEIGLDRTSLRLEWPALVPLLVSGYRSMTCDTPNTY